MRMIEHFLKDESAATAVEYGLIVAGIALTIIVAVNSLGTGVSDTFSFLTANIH